MNVSSKRRREWRPLPSFRSENSHWHNLNFLLLLSWEFVLCSPPTKGLGLHSKPWVNFHHNTYSISRRYLYLELFRTIQCLIQGYADPSYHQFEKRYVRKFAENFDMYMNFMVSGSYCWNKKRILHHVLTICGQVGTIKRQCVRNRGYSLPGE